MLLAAHFGLKLQDPVLLHVISVVHLSVHIVALVISLQQAAEAKK